MIAPPKTASLRRPTLPYTDIPSLRNAFRLHDSLHRRAHLPAPLAGAVVRALSRLRNPGEAARRRFTPTGQPAIAADEGYLLPDPARLPDAGKAVAQCRALFARHEADARAGRHTTTKPFLVTLAQDADFAETPEVLRFLLSAQVVDLMRGYLPRVPRLTSIRLWWSPPTDTVRNSQRFHLDHEDRRQIKLFLNVWDTDEENGPFTFLPAGTTARLLRLTGLRKRRIDDGPVEAALDRLRRDGAAPLLRLTGPAGSVALVDTSRCLHYGSRGVRRDRLVLTAQYVDFYAPHVPDPASWAQAAPRLGPLSPLQESVLGIRRRGDPIRR